MQRHGKADLQSIQGTIPYFTEYDVIPGSSPHKASLAALKEATSFIKEELAGLEEMLAEYVEKESWLDDDDSNLYFEFETRDGYSCNVSRAAASFSMCLGGQLLPGCFTGELLLSPLRNYSWAPAAAEG